MSVKPKGQFSLMYSKLTVKSKLLSFYTTCFLSDLVQVNKFSVSVQALLLPPPQLNSEGGQ